MKWVNAITSIAMVFSCLLFMKCDAENPTNPDPGNDSEKFCLDGKVFEIAYIWDDFNYEYKFDTVGINNLSLKLDTLSTQTDQDGNYQFFDIDSGQYKISITDSFYFPIDTLVKITSDTSINFELSPLTEKYFPLSTGNEWKYDYKYWMRGINCQDIRVLGIITWKIFNSDSLEENKYNYNLKCLFSGSEIVKTSNTESDTFNVADTLFFNMLEDNDRFHFQADNYNQKNKHYLWSLIHELEMFSLYTIINTYYPLYFDDNMTLYHQIDYEFGIKRGVGITYFKKRGVGHTCPIDHYLSLISSFSSD